MESPRFKLEPQTLSPSSSGRRSSDSNSPEFEFWMVRNPSFPQPNLLSADELFVDGVLLPLHLLRHNPDSSKPVQELNSEAPDSEPPIPDTEPEPGPGPEISSAAPASTASKRWKDIFKKGEKKSAKNGEDKEKEKEKKKERKSGSGASSAELNINIWPFSRSRSAGNNAVRPRMAAGGAGTRKVSSAPCSRSNSAGESKSRKWPSSPGRPGVHLGRSSPVWQVRRGGSASKSLEPLVRNAEKGSKKEGSENRRNRTPAPAPPAGIPKARVLNLNVPMCIGYRHHLSCRSDENSTIGTSHTIGSRGGGAGASMGNGGGGSGNVGSASNLFNLRSLFTKKVY
ncbi:hypothetical protein VitviT2T_014650 [Vitis vinifera]|uniref:Uncharacterized protein n=2 Tax=Vitis vinifera TaxID=29760 RepID=A0ABY9CKF8_VITVI|nr:uncharacterized protein LOC100251709 [Vitis vinifera]WJZ95914.1 hypothetical protein VitviT2T_014650 [Vitis vinifera]|eukprot:XP_002270044.1 PREDICTED: uncharacterized protein LOC100251709 [Vitis vinifera]